MIRAYTDGGCSPNPGIGAWAAVMVPETGEVVEISGSAPDTTNNRMELTGVIEAMKVLQDITGDAVIYTDSQYVRHGITAWVANWKRKGWRTSAGKPVLNQDLWKELDALVQKRPVQFQWVKGHSGQTYNERADTLCTIGIKLLTSNQQKLA